jgi:hypothetical protein
MCVGKVRHSLRDERERVAQPAQILLDARAAAPVNAESTVERIARLFDLLVPRRAPAKTV